MSSWTDPRAERRPLVIAHRGASQHASDNSLEAFALAATHRADGIETDVRFTGDGKVVLSHDASLPGFGRLRDHTFAELRDARPHVPTLDELLEPAAGLLLDIEIKNHPRDPDYDPNHRMAEVIAAWIGDNGLEKRTLVSSFNPATVSRFKQLAADTPTGLLLEHGREIRTELAGAAIAGNQWLLPRVGAMRIRSRTLRRMASAAGLFLGTWTVNSRRDMARLGAAEVDAIITNDPQKALAVYS